MGIKEVKSFIGEKFDPDIAKKFKGKHFSWRSTVIKLSIGRRLIMLAATGSVNQLEACGLVLVRQEMKLKELVDSRIGLSTCDLCQEKKTIWEEITNPLHKRILGAM